MASPVADDESSVPQAPPAPDDVVAPESVETTESIPEPAPAQEPVAEEAVAAEPVAEDLGAPEPVAAEEPAAEDPVVTEPVTVTPVAAEPVTAGPVGERPDFEEAGSPGDEAIPPPPPPPQPADSSPAPANRRTAVIVLSVLTVIVVGGAVAAVLWSRSGNDTATPPPTTEVPTTPTLPDSAFVTFSDPETNFTMRYPAGWRRSEAPVREVRLVASDGKQYSASVRVYRTAVETTPANLANIKAVTDGIVGADVQLLLQDTVTVNGLIGYRYIYNFTDKETGLVGSHLHYFLFQGNKMFSIVLEALPTGDFTLIEGTFDQMLASFRANPDPPAAGSPAPSTPSPPASTPG